MKTKELSSETLVRYVQGEMTRSENEATERLIADSRRAQERVVELRGLMDELARPPSWAASVDLVPELRERIARGDAPRQSARRLTRWFVGGGGLVAAAAVMAFLAWPAPEERGFRRKGGAVLDPDRWVGIQAVRPGAGGAAEPVAPGGHIGRGELQISYTNLGPEPYAFLMVFAIDAAGQVLWFYPAYERAGTDPAAIPIDAAAERLLPDIVEHAPAAGRLVLCGLFLRRPLSVGRVEAALGRRAPAPGQRLPFPESGQHCFDLESP